MKHLLNKVHSEHRLAVIEKLDDNSLDGVLTFPHFYPAQESTFDSFTQTENLQEKMIQHCWLQMIKPKLKKDALLIFLIRLQSYLPLALALTENGFRIRNATTVGCIMSEKFTTDDWANVFAKYEEPVLIIYASNGNAKPKIAIDRSEIVDLYHSKVGWRVPHVPPRLLDQLLMNFEDVPATVLDPFAGVGDSVLAGFDAGVNVIGVSNTPALAQIANQRIQTALNHTPVTLEADQ